METITCEWSEWKKSQVNTLKKNHQLTTHFVRTKARSSVVIPKSLASWRSLCARKASGLHYIKPCWLNHFLLPRDSKLLLFPLQKQVDHNLACLFRNLLCCYQLCSFVNTRKSCWFEKQRVSSFSYESEVWTLSENTTDGMKLWKSVMKLFQIRSWAFPSEPPISQWKSKGWL